MSIPLLGLCLYLANVAIGLAAQFRGVHFGRFHHVMYALVCVGVVAALIVDSHPGLWICAGALAVFPKARPKTVWHPALAGVGLAGYVWALLG